MTKSDSTLAASYVLYLFQSDLRRMKVADQGFELLQTHGGDTVGYCQAQAAEALSRGDRSLVAYWASLAKLAAVLSPPTPAE